MNIKRSLHAPPRAEAMIESLRGLGYTTATAIADIIDNSITAGADTVNLRFVWNHNSSRIEIQDNGFGMNSEELFMAMRLGEKSPLDERTENDLGRFGLGLKTASFSQCRILTAASWSNEELDCLRWDLDHLKTASDDGWYMLEGTREGSENLLDPLRNEKKGTLIIWEELDRIISENFVAQDFLNVIDKVEKHLSMIFHLYIEGVNPKLKIIINDKQINPWDPFLLDNPSKPYQSDMINCSIREGIRIQCHVLPHRDRLRDDEFEDAGGTEGWTAHQGFYVYRNKRLLLSGSWLGLGGGRKWIQDEAHRLARIRLDINNTSDSEWNIDIRKSSARPPVFLRGWLEDYAEDTRMKARRTFASRGRPTGITGSDDIRWIWIKQNFPSGIRYRIDREHPAVRMISDHLGDLKSDLNVMLRVIEETVPVQQIWVDTAENRETPRTEFSGEEPVEVKKILEVIYRNLLTSRSFSPVDARNHLLRSQPFQNYPELVKTLSDDPQE